MNISEVPIIFVESPTSRAYLNVLKDKKLFDTEILLMEKTYSIRFLENLNFKTINYYPLFS